MGGWVSVVPSIEFAFVSCAQSSRRAGGRESHVCCGVRRR